MLNFPMTENTKKIIDEAVAFAKRYNYACVGTESILYGICSRSSSVAGQLLSAYKITRETVLNALAKLKINHPRRDRFDYSDNAVYSIKHALELANDYSGAVTSEMLLYGLLKNSKSAAYTVIVSVLKVPADYLLSDISNLMGGQSTKMKTYPANIDDQFANALMGLFSGYSNAKDNQKKTYFSEQYNDDSFEKTQKNKQNSSQQKPTYNSKLPQDLLDMGIDMTAKVKGGKADPVIGRDAETERVIEILCRKTKNNPVLIGEAGVGKSAVVEGLAQRIVKGDVPEEMKGKTIYSFDIGGLMAGTKYRGSMEEKLKNLIDFIVANKDIIVFIDEIHMLAQAGSKEGEIGPADMLKPYLARGEFQTIGATTNEEYRKFIEKDKALERRFQPVTVLEPSEQDCVKILKGIRPSFEKFHGVKISDAAINAAVSLSVRYIMDRFLPDKAIDLIDEAASKLKVKHSVSSPEIEQLSNTLQEVLEKKAKASENEEYMQAEEYKKQAEDIKAEIEALKQEVNASNPSSKGLTVSEEDIAGIVSKWTKIPVSKLTESERDKLMKLEEILHKRVIGQTEAIVAVSKAIRRARAGLKDPKRPIGSFIFLGPTGVGKTELTKALAEALFDDENTVIRLDMSEYMESHSVSKLIGAPPGYVGHDDGGQLTEQVRRKPYSVVLFDEIEKAHPDVFNILLQMLDDGRLTDSLGHTVSFKNTIIIMTSNIGVSTLPKKSQTLGFGSEEKDENVDVKEHLMKALKERFKPEILNRIDQTIIFDRLSKDDITKIANILIDKLNHKLAPKGITLKFTKGAMQNIFEKGYDPEYGARPLKRYIEQNIEDGLAEEILMGNINDNENIIVSYKNNKFVFSAEKKDE